MKNITEVKLAFASKAVDVGGWVNRAIEAVPSPYFYESSGHIIAMSQGCPLEYHQVYDLLEEVLNVDYGIIHEPHMCVYDLEGDAEGYVAIGEIYHNGLPYNFTISRVGVDQPIKINIGYLHNYVFYLVLYERG